MRLSVSWTTGVKRCQAVLSPKLNADRENLAVENQYENTADPCENVVRDRLERSVVQDESDRSQTVGIEGKGKKT